MSHYKTINQKALSTSLSTLAIITFIFIAFCLGDYNLPMPEVNSSFDYIKDDYGICYATYHEKIGL
jgi:hypothetical protein